MNREKIKQIVSEALDLQGDQRDPFIRQTCGDDQSLLAEVRSLLGAASNANEAGFLPSGAFGGNPTEPVTIEKVGNAGETISVPIGEKPGSVIGRYKLIEQIGEGGFGVVFKAEQGKPVRRTVALKIIKLGMDTREVVARFEAERQALAMMDHPNIAKVLDAGTTETGRPYFVMELVRGSPVTEYADKHKLPTRDRVALAAQICRAVQHAHSKGIIHRDLKPSNVLVTVTDDKPVPKVIDFGIAKATQSPLTERTLYTAHRQLIGTPQYMSPEQADSDGSDIDTRSDIYSLGVLLYELLVGTTPMDARQLRSAAYDAMRKMIRDTEVPRPATRLHTLASDTQSAIAASRSTDLKKLAESVKGELDWIVMKALEKDRVRRYETASALADDLGRYLTGEVVLAGPVSGLYRFKKVARRYRAAIGVAALVGIALLLGVAGTTAGLVREGKQRKLAESRLEDANHARAEAEKQRQKAEVERDNADAVTEFLTSDVLGKASSEHTTDKALRDTLVKALIDPAAAAVGERFKDKQLTEVAIRNVLREVYTSLSHYDQALAQEKLVWEIDQRLLGPDDIQTIDDLNAYAMLMSMAGRRTEAWPLIKEAYDRSRRAVGDDSFHTLMARNQYAVSLSDQSRNAEAAPLFLQVSDGYRRLGKPDDEFAITALRNYAGVLGGYLDRAAEAIPIAQDVVVRARRAIGEDSSATMNALQTEASVLCADGRYIDGELVARDELQRAQRVLGEDHETTILATSYYSDDIATQGRCAEAEALAKPNWERARRVFGDDFLATDIAESSYVFTLIRGGKYAQAEPLARTALETVRRIHGDQDRSTWRWASNYGQILHGLGRDTEAEPLLRQSMVWAKELHHISLYEAVREGRYAAVLHALGRDTEAEPLIRHAVEVQRSKFASSLPEGIEAQKTFAAVLRSLGKPAEAAAVEASVPTVRPTPTESIH